MAEHTINIKTTLDLSQVQGELNRLNQQRQQGQNQNGPGQQGASGGLNNASLRSLDSSIKQLNRSLQQILRQANGPVQRNAYGQQYGNQYDPSMSTMGNVLKHQLPLFDPVRYRPEIASLDPHEMGDIDRANVLRKEAYTAYQQDLRSSRSENSSMIRRLRFGAMGHLAAGYMNDVVDLAGGQNTRFGQYASMVSSTAAGAASGFMVGGGVGAALGGLASAAIQAAKQLKAMEQAAGQLYNKWYSVTVQEGNRVLGEKVKNMSNYHDYSPGGAMWNDLHGQLAQQEKYRDEAYDNMNKTMLRTDLSTDKKAAAVERYAKDYQDAIK